jgi:DNA polymerase-1
MAMSRTYLLLDSNFLAYRLFHAMGELSYGAVKTGVIFGFLRSIPQFQDQFGTDAMVFCFDRDIPKRRALLPEYKARRHAPTTQEERDVRAYLYEQVELLRTRYLPRIGYVNIFSQKGYEADDVIARVVQDLSPEDEAIIISADSDLYQLLAPNVLLYNPRHQRMVTYRSFLREKGIRPEQWARVRAIAGCHTDEIPGVPRVGEKTAIKFLLGMLKPTLASYAAICSEEGREIVHRNKALVKLPFKGIGAFPIQPDRLSYKGWYKVCDDLGMQSLKGRDPLSQRAARHTASFGLR